MRCADRSPSGRSPAKGSPWRIVPQKPRVFQPLNLARRTRCACAGVLTPGAEGSSRGKTRTLTPATTRREKKSQREKRRGLGCFAARVLPPLLLPHLLRMQPRIATVLAAPRADQLALPRIGSTSLQKLNAPQLNAMYAEMLESGRRNGKGGLSVRTVRYTHTVIRKALADAVGWNLLTRNVADAAQPPKKQKTTNATWSADQLRTFLSHVQEDRLFATWQLAAMTGMRRGEILGLSWADIDFDNARLSVRRSLVSSDYKIKVSEPKTERGRRTVALDPAMLRVLRDHQGRQLLERVAMAGDWGNELDLVFTRDDGSPIHPQAFSEMFEKHVKDSKLPKLSLHGVRHTHATIALRAGVHPKVVSERLGHASVAFTLDVYTDSLPDMQETAANLIAALVLDT